jgi:hypothetical protein
MILLIVLYWCGTWCLTVTKEHRLRVFENRVLRRMLGPKRDEVTGEWRRLHSGELRSSYLSKNIIRPIKSGRIRGAGHVARMGEGRKVHKGLVGKPEGKRLLGRPSVDDRMSLKWMFGRMAGRVWIGFTWLRVGADGGIL